MVFRCDDAYCPLKLDEVGEAILLNSFDGSEETERPGMALEKDVEEAVKPCERECPIKNGAVQAIHDRTLLQLGDICRYWRSIDEGSGILSFRNAWETWYRDGGPERFFLKYGPQRTCLDETGEFSLNDSSEI